jgi:hypothetical protein
MKYFRQNVSLTGLGSATFSSALDTAQVIYKHFDREFLEGKLDSWSPTRSTDSRLDSLDISNRYLTPLRDVGGLVENTPFHKGVDPQNILCDMAKNNHIHTEDNYVEYFSTRRDSNGQRRSITKAQQNQRKKLTAISDTDSSLANRKCSEWAILFKRNYLSSLFQ